MPNVASLSTRCTLPCTDTYTPKHVAGVEIFTSDDHTAWVGTMRAARHTADIRPQEEEATILDALRAFERDGYTGQFAARNNAHVECLQCHRDAPAADIPLQGAHRLEGTSDPDDEVLVAALACPHCGAHGTVVLKYGPTAPAEDLEVLAALRDERGAHPLDPK